MTNYLVTANGPNGQTKQVPVQAHRPGQALAKVSADLGPQWCVVKAEVK